MLARLRSFDFVALGIGLVVALFVFTLGIQLYAVFGIRHVQSQNVTSIREVKQAEKEIQAETAAIKDKQKVLNTAFATVQQILTDDQQVLMALQSSQANSAQGAAQGLAIIQQIETQLANLCHSTTGCQPVVFTSPSVAATTTTTTTQPGKGHK